MGYGREREWLDCLLLLKAYVRERVKDSKCRDLFLEIIEEVEGAVAERRIEALKMQLLL